MARSALVLFVVAACARGGQSGNGDDQPAKVDAPSTQQQDANTSMTPDSSMNHPDASVPMVDATVPMVDAASSLFCTSNAECTVSGECCITLGGPNGFCGKGTVVFGQCVPQ